MPEFRVGHGYDVHPFEKGRKLLLGGVDIPSEYGLGGHSDADVLLHAIMDAILGALALPDIGQMFPDSDERLRGISSMELLHIVAGLLFEKKARLVNIDSTLIMQEPKIAPYVKEMVRNIADATMIKKDRVNVKATTEEHLGFTGRMEGAAAHAVVMIKFED